MFRKVKFGGNTNGVISGAVLGVLVCLLLTLSASAILAWMISAETIDMSSTGYGAIVILVLSSFAGSLVAAEKVKRLRVQMCLITGAAYFLSLLSVTALFFGGQYQGMLVTAIMILIGSMSAALLGIKRRKYRKSKF